jgi:hypothetical protein
MYIYNLYNIQYSIYKSVSLFALGSKKRPDAQRSVNLGGTMVS